MLVVEPVLRARDGGRGAVVTAVALSPVCSPCGKLNRQRPLGIRYLDGDAARLREYL